MGGEQGNLESRGLCCISSVDSALVSPKVYTTLGLPSPSLAAYGGSLIPWAENLGLWDLQLLLRRVVQLGGGRFEKRLLTEMWTKLRGRYQRAERIGMEEAVPPLGGTARAEESWSLEECLHQWKLEPESGLPTRL